MYATFINKSKKKFGFLWKNGHINIATENAEHKLLQAFLIIYQNKTPKTIYKKYLKSVILISMEKNIELILMKNLSKFWSKKIDKLSNGKIVIGLNTGCGLRWKTRLWPKEYWISLINILQSKITFVY